MGIAVDAIPMVWSEKHVKEFAEKVLVPLERDEVYLLLLCARKKYCQELSRSEEVLKREIVRYSDPDYFYRKLLKIAPQPDSYIDINTRKPIPRDAMAIYVVINPKSCIKAYTKFMKEVEDWLYELGVSDNEDWERFRRLDTKLFSAMHKSTSRHLYWIVDIDKHDHRLLELSLIHI